MKPSGLITGLVWLLWLGLCQFWFWFMLGGRSVCALMMCARRAFLVLQVFSQDGHWWVKPAKWVSMCCFTVYRTLLEKWHWAHCQMVLPTTGS